jgi:hypothetical protein
MINIKNSEQTMLTLLEKKRMQVPEGLVQLRKLLVPLGELPLQRVLVKR